ncbi:S9 family peptidase [Alteribacter lacisalsi]|uniref:S9 family peptidase n=1 Tax=Alteribacter lacisalsi TaxID=2045244 RepID=A0A2W0H7E0_9BACI|nr:S9 family peptidase [Alteribacter lacisalsi]PYZ97764.1 S9 family peptidase [Alteribacter lacisalsi]
MQFPGHSVEQFFRTYAITNFTVSSDEKRILFSTNLNGKMNVWAMDLPGGFPYLFTQTEQSCSDLKEDPNKTFVIGGFDHDGDENYHLYAMPYAGGKKTKLIDGEKEDKFFFAHLNEEGKNLYYSTSQGNPNFLRGHRLNLETGDSVQLYDGKDGATTITAVSPDERHLVLSKHLANTYVLAELLNVETGERKMLSEDPERIHVVGEAAFAGDHTLYFVTNDNSEHDYVVKYDLTSGERSTFAAFDNESVSAIHWHEESETLYVETEKGVEDRIYHVSSETGKPENLRSPVKVLGQVSVSKSGQVYVLGTSATEPVNLYLYNNDGEWQKLTENRVPGVETKDMADPEVVSYRSFDEKEIEALWFKAKPENDNGHVIFWPHGGPQAAERKTFRAMFQCFLNEGYSIFAPNFRGSTGYGATFTKLVEQDWGEGPRLDCTAGIEWLFETGKCDPDRLFLLGGSYGGYMALLLHGRHPDYFRAVIDIFGVSNLFTFLNSVPDHWKPVMKRWLGDPVEDKERLEKDSPITYLSTMKQPMLVIQGANDPRVVKEESDQIVEALQKQGTEVEYLVLDDEGHGFSKKENEIRVYKSILGFLSKYRA